MLSPTGEAKHEEARVREPEEHLPHCDAFQFCRIHLSCAETSLAPTDPSRTAALLFQMYSLSKDI